MTHAESVGISGVTIVVTTDAAMIAISGVTTDVTTDMTTDVTTGMTIGVTTDVMSLPPGVHLRNLRSPNPRVPILSGQQSRWMLLRWQLGSARWKNALKQENSRQHHPRTKRTIGGIMITGAPTLDETKFIQTAVEKPKMVKDAGAIGETVVRARNSMRTRPGGRDPVPNRPRS